jgi:hypothetical protein
MVGSKGGGKCVTAGTVDLGRQAEVRGVLFFVFSAQH